MRKVLTDLRFRYGNKLGYYLLNNQQMLGIYYQNQRWRTCGRRTGWYVQIRAAIARGRDVGLRSHLADACGQPAQPNNVAILNRQRRGLSPGRYANVEESVNHVRLLPAVPQRK
jgi:hypothetical protein